MIDTEIYEIENYNNYNCFDEGLKIVNDLIKEKEIEKSDIVEYRTENWAEDKNGVPYYHYKIVISWWK